MVKRCRFVIFARMVHRQDDECCLSLCLSARGRWQNGVVTGCFLVHTQWAAGPDGTQEDLSDTVNEKIPPRSTLHIKTRRVRTLRRSRSHRGRLMSEHKTTSSKRHRSVRKENGAL